MTKPFSAYLKLYALVALISLPFALTSGALHAYGYTQRWLFWVLVASAVVTSAVLTRNRP